MKTQAKCPVCNKLVNAVVRIAIRNGPNKGRIKLVGLVTVGSAHGDSIGVHTVKRCCEEGILEPNAHQF